eukprot:9476275-Pyramimonas_sp.AAC.3
MDRRNSVQYATRALTLAIPTAKHWHAWHAIVCAHHVPDQIISSVAVRGVLTEQKVSASPSGNSRRPPRRVPDTVCIPTFSSIRATH